jgi:hypothetical protein
LIIRFGGSFPPWSETHGDNLVTRESRGPPSMRCSPILIRCLRRNSDGANVPALGDDVADKLRKKVEDRSR